MTEALRNELQTAIGTRYTLERELGRGGMATVYLARDAKHERLVALKVLDPELGAVLGADRFLSEIRVTAGLQHPNLLPLFDSGTANGLLYYVMPFVEGETLRQRLDREKQLPIDEAVHIAVAVANALDYAHAHGVIHRDLKPENILLQHGQPVVADFGIALAISNAGGARVTQTGLSLGTPQYMSPEQATGDRVIDGRTDVYSLAAVTYEMLAWEPPHSGTTAQAIIAKLMTSQPQPVRALRPTTPPNVAAAVERGLAKLPADRFATALAFAAALTNPSFEQADAAARPTPARVREIVLASMLAAAMAIALWAWLRPAPALPVIRYTLVPDSTASIARVPRWGRVALSPDGSTLAYVGGPHNTLFVQRRDQLRATEIGGTEGAAAPFFSPDGSRIAFFKAVPGTTTELLIVTLDGAAPFVVTDSLVGTAGGTWGPDDVIYADGNGQVPLVRVPAHAGSKPEYFNVLDSTNHESDATYPCALPNGRGILFATIGGRADAPRRGMIAVTEGLTRKRHVVIDNAIRAVYVHPNRVLYETTDGRLMTAPFDLGTLRIAGDPTLVADGLLRAPSGADFAVSRTGRLAYMAGYGNEGGYTLVWTTRDGRTTPVDSAWHSIFSAPDISPDQTQIAVSTTAVGGAFGVAPSDIWIDDLRSGSRRKLTVEGGDNTTPVWSADGEDIFYTSSTPNGWTILRRHADGSGQPQTIARGKDLHATLSVSADGKWLFYTQGTGPAHGQMYGVRLTDSTFTPIALLADGTTQRRPVLSPDGRWLAYAGTAGGWAQVYVVPFPNTRAGKWLVASGAAQQPLWSHSGTELFFRQNDSIVALPVSARGSTFTFGKPHALFLATAYPSNSSIANYSISRDDSRFLMVRLAGDELDERLTIVENWTAELARKR